MYKDDPRYNNLVGQPGSTPHEIFEDALNEEKDILKIHKPAFKTLIKVRILVSTNLLTRQMESDFQTM